MAKEGTSRRTIAGDVYRIIYNNPEVSRKQLVSDLGLSLPTIDNYLRQLITDGYITVEEGTLESTGGRKANAYTCIPDARYAAGLDITRNHVNAVLIDILGNTIISSRSRVPFEDSDAYFSHIASILEDLLGESGIDDRLLLGVGISMPIILKEDQKTPDYARVIHVSDKLYVHIGKYIKYPYLLFNDANSAGLAERWHSENQTMAVYISLNPSVGGATIKAGNTIHRGDNNRASEFGHLTIVPGGKRCYCGRKGCVDAYCSETILSDFTDGDLAEFFEQLPNNTGFQNVFDNYLDHLALAVYTLRICYDCDVIIGGNVGQFMEPYMDLLKAKVSRLSPFERTADYIRACRYTHAASSVGAALYYVNNFISEM